MKYTAIRSEGGLLPYDLLDEILAEIVPGQKPADFGLPKGRRVSDEIQRVWSDALELWSRFKAGREKLSEKDPNGTTLTRDRWIGPLLTDPVRLSYDLHYQPSAVVLEGLTFAISHRAGEPPDSPPVHIEGCEIELDKRPLKYRTSPQAMVQEFLNRSEPHLWGVVTNGLRFRLLRDSVRTARPTYLEFDLETILEGVQYNEFVLFYRLCHRTRLPQPGHPPEDCLLEKYYQQSIEKGGRVRDNLRDGVEEALKVLGTGFLRHPDNAALRERIDASALNADQFHRQLLLLVYRLLFLTVAEDRHLIISIGEHADRNQSIYRDYYSIGRLRDRAEGILEDSGFSDLWVGLTQTFKLFSDSNDTNPVGIPPLNGDLFSNTTVPDLETAHLSNLDLLKAVRWLMFYRERSIQQRVNYAALDVEELGSVYESLLDFRPIISKEADGREFNLGVGGERRSTGSYYTRPELVRLLIQSALVPVIEDRLSDAEKQNKGQSSEVMQRAKIDALLKITVCDPACGSGHFILEAARRLGKELARIRAKEDEPTPEQFHMAVREVISHCIYGVDVNPLAVDLCKLALWLEGHWAGKPLSFLDHRIRCGNSLIGVFDPVRMKEGIPDEAFTAVTGDDKKVAAAFKRQNQSERVIGQKRLDFDEVKEDHGREYATLFGMRLDFPEEKPSDVRRKSDLFEEARKSKDWWHDWTASNLWTSAFFFTFSKLDDPFIPTHESFLEYLVYAKDKPQMTGNSNALSEYVHFFHWTLEYPEVFERGGFDVVLGNPPWERIKLQEEEHWADDPYIATAKNKAERSKRIAEYSQSPNQEKQKRFRQFIMAKHTAEASSKFVRHCGFFPLTAVGDINTYSLFAELSRQLLSGRGHAGIVLPAGIATDDSTKDFFSATVEKSNLVSLIGFENENFIFSDVHNEFKFCAFTITGSNWENPKPDFAFFCRYFEHVYQKERHFSLSSSDFALLNPNTRTCPIFRTGIDSLLTKKIYGAVPILVNEQTNSNSWRLDFLRMFDMANDSELFLDSGGPELVPLYEAKMIWQFDHRFASLLGEANAQGRPSRKFVGWYGVNAGDPTDLPVPRYWVPQSEVDTRLDQWKKQWLVGFRDITNSTNERTVIFSILPRVGTGHTLPLALLGESKRTLCFMANVNCLVFDYIARQKIGGTHLTYNYLNQLPVFAPNMYSAADLEFIQPRALELVYTSCDLEPFARDMGYSGKPYVWDDSRRADLRAELDAYYAHLYRMTRDELRYVLDPTGVFGADYPGKTFAVLKQKEISEFGQFRTQRLLEAAFEQLSSSDRFRGEKRECTIMGKQWTVGD
jgi:hypothetical protein